jgi:hypothetical protein
LPFGLLGGTEAKTGKGKGGAAMKKVFSVSQIAACSLIAGCGGIMVIRVFTAGAGISYAALAWTFLLAGCLLTKISYTEIRKGGRP